MISSLNVSFEAKSLECSWIVDSFWGWGRSNCEILNNFYSIFFTSPCVIGSFESLLFCFNFTSFWYFCMVWLPQHALLWSCTLFGERMKKPQTGSVTFCEISIVTLLTGKLWRVLFSSIWGLSKEWSTIKNVGGNCIYHVIYWSFAVASKVKIFTGRRQKDFFYHWWTIKVILFPSVFGHRSGSTVTAGINLFPCLCVHTVFELEQYCIRV